jgi:hypothetical protein
MRVTDITLKLLGLTRTIAEWRTTIVATDADRRERIARYAEAIAGTLGRAAAAFERLEQKPADKAAMRRLLREVGRLRGYVEDITGTMRGRIDGRRLAGVERRLENIAREIAVTERLAQRAPGRIERLAAAEGYFRALADSARAR